MLLAQAVACKMAPILGTQRLGNQLGHLGPDFQRRGRVAVAHLAIKLQVRYSAPLKTRHRGSQVGLPKSVAVAFLGGSSLWLGEMETPSERRGPLAHRTSPCPQS